MVMMSMMACSDIGVVMLLTASMKMVDSSSRVVQSCFVLLFDLVASLNCAVGIV